MIEFWAVFSIAFSSVVLGFVVGRAGGYRRAERAYDRGYLKGWVYGYKSWRDVRKLKEGYEPTPEEVEKLTRGGHLDG